MQVTLPAGRRFPGRRFPVWGMLRVTYECVVVGAGAAGVTTSRALAEAGVDHVVLERGDIGNTWATQRWDAFRLNTPGSMNALLGDVAPHEYSTRDETVAAPQGAAPPDCRSAPGPP